MKASRNVTGVVVTPTEMKTTKVTVRISDDAIGKSISLSDDKRGIMLMIPVEPLKDLIEVK